MGKIIKEIFFEKRVNIFNESFFRGDYSSLPVCSVRCTVHLQLFTNIDILLVRPESFYDKQICSTLSVWFMAYKISKELAYIITLYTITSLIFSVYYFNFV